MPISSPYIPQTITVHLGSPDSFAANVTVAFPDYIKNVVSSEIYPTWEPEAISANTLAIVSFALNRVYTEFYRSRGYDFDITSSTAIDQKYIQGRNIFENVSRQVDILFDDYIRRRGFVEPLAAKFCNGTTVTCNGLSQWGSQELAKSGLNSYSILQNYFGSNIEIVANANIRGIQESYPGTPQRLGSTGVPVRFLQVELNRISQNYPAIPKVPEDGIFGEKTEQAVRAFQPIFSLEGDGVVGRATWYRIVQVYVAVLGLAELESQGLNYSSISWEYPDAITLGNSGIKVAHLQYMLAVLSRFIDEIPLVAVTGSFGKATLAAVKGFQRFAGLKVTGVVGAAVWDAIYSQFEGINGTVFNDAELFPFSTSNFTEGRTLTQSGDGGGSALTVRGSSGNGESRSRRGMSPVQRQRREADGAAAPPMLCHSGSASASGYQRSTRYPQHPWRDLTVGMRDEEMRI